MRYTTQYISSMINCAESKLAAASTIAHNREYYGLYGLTDSLWHIQQLVLYLFLLKRWDNSPAAQNASTEKDLSNIFDRIIRMPYSCILQVDTGVPTVQNHPPIVSAGPDQNLSAGTSSATLAGTVTDPDGDSFTVIWSKISGGNVTITSPGTTITSLTNMSAGTYVFQLTATDSNGGSSSDQVTITIAAALDTIYYWSDDNPFPGVSRDTYIKAQHSFQTNGALDIDVPWNTIQDHPQWCGVAIPNKSSAYDKNKWFIDIINQGNIGGTTDLFGSSIIVNIDGTDYLVWNTNYQTQFFNTCTLKKV